MTRLMDLEVEEVSLVDRPATGRRFRLFKRAEPVRLWDRLRGGALGSEQPPSPGTEPEETAAGEWQEEKFAPAEIEKRMEEALDAVTHALGTLTDRLDEIQKRLDTAPLVEEPVHARQSLDPAPGKQASIWKGVF